MTFDPMDRLTAALAAAEAQRDAALRDLGRVLVVASNMHASSCRCSQCAELRSIVRERAREALAAAPPPAGTGT